MTNDALLNVTVRKPMKYQPLGARQHRILMFARSRDAEGKSFPTPRECAKYFQYKGPASDIKESFRALERRGLIERTPRGHRVTAAGWALPWTNVNRSNRAFCSCQATSDLAACPEARSRTQA